jgi:predicted PurR-regulated permease PerM
MSDHPRAPTNTGTDPARRRRRIFSSLRRVTRLWGFLGFVILVLVLARGVILPFVFALLVAHILAPVVRRMAHRPDGTLRMPRWVAVIVCYTVFLGVLSTAMITLLPRFTGELTRMARELPALYTTINDDWAPKLAGWIEERFPAAERPRPPVHPIQPGQSDFLPRDTTFVLSPLPDGRTAVELPPGGLALIPRHDGGFDVRSDKPPTESVDLEDRIRLWTRERLQGLQSRVDDLVRVGQGLVVGFARGIFSFFLVLMVAAFILLDLEKVNGFGRSLVPMVYRDDYDRIVQSINRGLTGVIRGQLIICLVNGILTYIGLLIFNVDYALILAMVAAVLSVIPIFGSIVSTIPIVTVALLSGEDGVDIVRGLASLAWIIGIHLLEANMLNPKIMGTSARIHPLLVIFALIVGEHYYGLVGAILAVPVMSMTQVLFVYLRKKALADERDPTKIDPAMQGPALPPAT